MVQEIIIKSCNHEISEEMCQKEEMCSEEMCQYVHEKNGFGDEGKGQRNNIVKTFRFNGIHVYSFCTFWFQKKTYAGSIFLLLFFLYFIIKYRNKRRGL